jgi:hypothetical protein
MDAFEKNEIAQGRGMYQDPRWKEVEELRKKGEHSKANGLVMSIRWDYVEGGY